MLKVKVSSFLLFQLQAVPRSKNRSLREKYKHIRRMASVFLAILVEANRILFWTRCKENL